MVSTSLRDSIVKRRYGGCEEVECDGRRHGRHRSGGAPAGDGHDHDDDNEHGAMLTLSVLSRSGTSAAATAIGATTATTIHDARNLGQAHGRAGPSGAR